CVPGGVSPNNRHLLIFDGHGSHVALGTIQEARSLGIDLLTLPAHTSHKLQPLDVSVFAPFKSYFKEERRKWLFEKHGIDVNRAELATLGSRAFQKALSPENIKAGFKRTGIWPLNPHALDEDMAPSKTFDTSSRDESHAAENILRLARDNLEVSSSELCSEDVEIVLNTQTSKECDAEHNEQNTNESVQQQTSTQSGGSQFNESLALPTQVSCPDWMKEAALNLGVNLNNIEEDTLCTPSQPSVLHESDVVHYFVNTLDEEHIDAAELEEADIRAENGDKTFEENRGQSSISKFLKLPMERVKDSSRSNCNDGIRLSRESQLITTDQYMELLMEKEKRKKEIEELKQRKRVQMQEKKAERIAERERKEQEKIEKEIRRQEKEHQKSMQRQEKEMKKEQERIQRDQERKEKEFEKARRELGRQRRLSTPQNPLPEEHPLLRELISMHCPQLLSVHNVQPG
ncbi:hypothetical protein KI387_042453, partial [Taxus chinensis]